MTIIFVVEYYEDGKIRQHGFALTEERAEEECEALHRRRGGNRLDYWVEAYTCKDEAYESFD